MIIAAQDGVARDGYVVFQPSSTTYPDMGTNNAMVTDTDFIIEFGSWVYHRCMGNDCCHG
jgi:hypothetical protein